jgi:adenosylcobinamide-phosphate synthase
LFSALIFFLALAADAIIGDPPRWPHMVRGMGGIAGALEKLSFRYLRSPKLLRLAGLGLVLVVVGGSAAATCLALHLAELAWPPLAAAMAVILGFECLSAGQLWREARDVAKPLREGDLDTARQRLSMIVGRDTAELTPAGIRRAVIETIAENLNDGVVAPLFYLVLGGPAAAVAYKAVNTLDSMVGYQSPRYRHLGFFPAKLDDLAGWLPARLTALMLAAAAGLLGLSAGKSLRVLMRDHKAHKSPNAGWPEAAMAGALGLRLGGPNHYGGVLVEKPWLNPAGRDPKDADLPPAYKLLWAVNLGAGGLGLLLTGLTRGWL